MLFEPDFAPDALTVREQVIAGGFTNEVGPDGAIYTGISKFPVPHWFELIAQVRKRPIVPKLSCFRLNLAGELPHSWVHSDDICATYASVLYLNLPEQCVGGTAFWQRKDGLLQLPKGQSDEYYAEMSKSWKDLSQWKMIQLVEMQWNRFITYPTSYFHSRYPFEAFGTGPQDGRLIWICFYDLEVL